ncbi:baculoviral IAP repeat containing 5b [Silurus asotus]|uniref:Baculoviral IAP repeat containing 5b n=1 Tax=Silurus asotus TaxID=30991 RepID=A0AAD5FDP6_SILAS|nr:baculoviral IAP repeat containing 5b [Silurus asotus]
MYSYEKRLQTFADWPFREDCQCTPELMARAGFVHCPSENEPDVACCFYCLKELEGWEPEDIPWSEHAKRSPDCEFLQMKPFDKLTAIEFFRLEHGRIRNYICEQAGGLALSQGPALLPCLLFVPPSICPSSPAIVDSQSWATSTMQWACGGGRQGKHDSIPIPLEAL